jgi:hypothetical protein
MVNDYGGTINFHRSEKLGGFRAEIILKYAYTEQ